MVYSTLIITFCLAHFGTSIPFGLNRALGLAVRDDLTSGSTSSTLPDTKSRYSTETIRVSSTLYKTSTVSQDPDLLPSAVPDISISASPTTSIYVSDTRFSTNSQSTRSSSTTTFKKTTSLDPNSITLTTSVIATQSPPETTAHVSDLDWMICIDARHRSQNNLTPSPAATPTEQKLPGPRCARSDIPCADYNPPTMTNFATTTTKWFAPIKSSLPCFTLDDGSNLCATPLCTPVMVLHALATVASCSQDYCDCDGIAAPPLTTNIAGTVTANCAYAVLPTISSCPGTDSTALPTSSEATITNYPTTLNPTTQSTYIQSTAVQSAITSPKNTQQNPVSTPSSQSTVIKSSGIQRSDSGSKSTSLQSEVTESSTMSSSKTVSTSTVPITIPTSVITSTVMTSSSIPKTDEIPTSTTLSTTTRTSSRVQATDTSETSYRALVAV